MIAVGGIVERGRQLRGQVEDRFAYVGFDSIGFVVRRWIQCSAGRRAHARSVVAAPRCLPTALRRRRRWSSRPSRPVTDAGSHQMRESRVRCQVVPRPQLIAPAVV